jgi:hypothetical protein
MADDREQMGQQVAPGVVQRISQGLSYMISGVTPLSWFGPNQPIAPVAQDQTEGRQFDLPVGYNLRIEPRSGEIPFSMLRAFADSYDLLRLVIETRKDQLEAFEWELVPKDEKAPKGSLSDEIRAVTDFLEKPDRELLWPQWLRRWLEELFVIDASVFYPRTDRSGHLYGLEVIDGATIKRVIDDQGRTPVPPSVAYQQVLHGIPANDLSSDDLIYIMRNPRVNRIYGYAPVEQVMATVNIALRRQMSQLDVYTSGNVPEALAQVPDTWTAKMIGDFQTWFDSMLAGNSARKRRINFIPKMEGILFPRADVIKDEYDEWLARIICFAFSISPTALIKQPNRAVSESMADAAKEEGLLPLLKFISVVMTHLINRTMVKGLRFQFKTEGKLKPLEQAKVDQIYYEMEARTPDEIRERLGDQPMTPEQRLAAFPSPPLPLAGFQQPPSTLDNNPDTNPPGVSPPGTKQEVKPPAAKMLDGLQVHIHAPPVTVDTGDTHVHMPKQAAPVVKVYGDTHIQAPPMPIPLRKRVTAERDAQGKLFGEITIEGDEAAATAQLTKMVKDAQEGQP